MHSMRRSAAVSFLLLSLPLLAQAPTTTPTPADPLVAPLAQALQERLGDVPGAQTAIAFAGGRLVRAHAGVADRTTKAPMDDDGLLLLGSTGKTLFAALAMQLVREGKLDLDAKVATWFAKEAWYARVPNAQHVTIRHLLMHRSGIMRYEFAPEFVQRLLAEPDHRFTPREELAFVLDKEPAFEAGKGFEYSDTNYVLLGLVLEQITGKPCYDAIRERFLQPLGLRGLVPSVGRKIPGLLQGHAGDRNEFGGRDAMLVDGQLPFDAGFEGAGGGFAGNAGDLARWGRALYGGDVLKDVRDLVVAGEPAPLGKQARYGLGCIVAPSPHGPAWGHRGFFPGWLSELRHYPERGVTVAVIVNSSADLRVSGRLAQWADDFVALATKATPAAAK